MADIFAQIMPNLVFAAVTAVVGWLAGRIKGSKEERDRKRDDLTRERDMTRSVLRLLLLYRLTDLHERHVIQGRPCSMEAKRSIEEVYGLYHELGGNGQGTHMYHELMEAHVA